MTEQAVIAAPGPSLVTKFADRYGVDANKLVGTLKATCFKTNQPISNEQMMAMLIVADQYNLNPFTREIFAYPDKGAIVPVVSVDGWSRIINSHPDLDGIYFNYSDKIITTEGAKDCPAWCEVTIHRKSRSKPTTVREYLDEVYKGPFEKDGRKINGPWQSHTKRFLRHKTLIQGARIAFGFAGIYDEDEAQRIRDQSNKEGVVINPAREQAKNTLDSLNDDEKPPKYVDAEFTEETHTESEKEVLENTENNANCYLCDGNGIIETVDGKEPCECQNVK